MSFRFRVCAFKAVLFQIAVLTVQASVPDSDFIQFRGERFHAASSNAQSVSSNGSVELIAGKTFGQRLKPGDVHSYTVSAIAGQYFRVVIIQKGIDLAVKVIAPDGKQVIDVDSPNARNGPEPVSLIAAVSGRYRLDVRAMDLEAIAGDYEITLRQSGKPTALDRERVAAERMLVEAQLLHAQGTRDSLQEAIAEYDRALPMLRAIGDQEKEAETLTVLGRIYFLRGEFHRAVEYYDQALTKARLLADLNGEALRLAGLGGAYSALGEYEKGLQFLQQALTLNRALKDKFEEAHNLRDIGNDYAALNRRQAAFESLEQSLTLAREVQHRRLQGQVLSYLGVFFSNYGEPEPALNYFKQALDLHRAIRDQFMEGRTLGYMATVYLGGGEIEQALNCLKQSLAIHRATGNQSDEILTLAQIGGIYSSFAEPRLALNYFEESLSLARTLQIRRDEAYVLYVGAQIYWRIGDTPRALDYLNRAKSLYESLGLKYPNLLTLLGIMNGSIGRQQEAVDILQEARKLFKNREDRSGEAFCLSELGALYSSLGRTEEAKTLLERALTAQTDGYNKSHEALTLYRLARNEQIQRRFQAAHPYIERAVAIIEGLRSKLYDDQLRVSFSAANSKYYELYVDVLMQMHRTAPMSGYDATALEVNERARARNLLETLSTSRVDIRQGVDPALLTRERTAQQRLNAKAEWLMRLLNGRHTAEQASEGRKEVENLIDAYREIEAAIRSTSPHYAALTQPNTLSLRQIQQNILDNETVLVEYVLGEERSYAFVVSTTTLSTYELPKRQDIEKAAQFVYDLFVKKVDDVHPEALAQLSQMILAPIARELSHRRLLIVSDGALQYIPFTALPEPTMAQSDLASTTGQYKPLILTHEIVSSPSASVLAILGQRNVTWQNGVKTLAVIADPVFDKADRRVTKIRQQSSAARDSEVIAADPRESSEVERAANDMGLAAFERLPMSRTEAEFITEHLSKTEFLKALDFDADRKLALSSYLSEYRIIHFATHSLLNNEHPELSGIVLSLVDKEGRMQDGFLRLNEIYNLKLNSDLVVLSACQTALGKEVTGEGLIGLTRGFMYAGARRVVASMWKVSDAATAELMRRFYRKMFDEKMRPAAALRAAQISMMKNNQWRAPYYWAPFTFQGEWK